MHGARRIEKFALWVIAMYNAVLGSAAIPSACCFVIYDVCGVIGGTVEIAVCGLQIGIGAAAYVVSCCLTLRRA